MKEKEKDNSLLNRIKNKMYDFYKNNTNKENSPNYVIKKEKDQVIYLIYNNNISIDSIYFDVSTINFVFLKDKKQNIKDGKMFSITYEKPNNLDFKDIKEQRQNIFMKNINIEIDGDVINLTSEEKPPLKIDLFLKELTILYNNKNISFYNDVKSIKVQDSNKLIEKGELDSFNKPFLSLEKLEFLGTAKKSNDLLYNLKNIENEFLIQSKLKSLKWNIIDYNKSKICLDEFKELREVELSNLWIENNKLDNLNKINSICLNNVKDLEKVEINNSNKYSSSYQISQWEDCVPKPDYINIKLNNCNELKEFIFNRVLDNDDMVDEPSSFIQAINCSNLEKIEVNNNEVNNLIIENCQNLSVLSFKERECYSGNGIYVNIKGNTKINYKELFDKISKSTNTYDKFNYLINMENQNNVFLASDKINLRKNIQYIIINNEQKDSYMFLNNSLMPIKKEENLDLLEQFKKSYMSYSYQQDINKDNDLIINLYCKAVGNNNLMVSLLHGEEDEKKLSELYKNQNKEYNKLNESYINYITTKKQIDFFNKQNNGIDLDFINSIRTKKLQAYAEKIYLTNNSLKENENIEKNIIKQQKLNDNKYQIFKNL